MDEAHEILLSSLKSSGVSLPVGVSSINHLYPDALVSICAQSLILILDSADSSFPTSLPTETAERFKVCAKLASAIKSIGYKEDLSFHQLLYPSNEESYKLVRFLVERLSEVFSEGIKVDKTRSTPENNEAQNNSFEGQSSRTSSSEPESSGSKKNSRGSATSKEVSDIDKSFIDEPEIKWSSQQERITKLRNEIRDMKKQEKILMDKMHARTLDVHKLQDEHDILKSSLGLAINSEQSVELFVQELDAKVKIRQQSVMELEIKRNLAECSVIGKSMNLEQSVYPEQPEVQESHLQSKKIEWETQATLDEISMREAEYLDLLMELEKQPKLPSRKLYIKRITEITKNSWKLDADIQQILKETRELQLESNSIQERLHRTYAVVDEIVFREAKKDAVGRRAYRLLTSIHDIFQQIADTILATDRARRETVSQESKLAALSSRSFDITKLQADLDSIRKENELLEQQCCRSY